MMLPCASVAALPCGSPKRRSRPGAQNHGPRGAVNPTIRPWEARQDWAKAGRIYDRGLALYPGNAILLEDKAWSLDKRGMKQEAFAAIKKAADVGPATAWTVARFREYSISALGADAAKSEIEALRQRQPWNQSVWSDAAGALGEDQIAKEANWEAARAANPEEP